MSDVKRWLSADPYSIKAFEADDVPEDYDGTYVLASDYDALADELAEAKRLRDDARNQWALCSEDRARVEAERDALAKELQELKDRIYNDACERRTRD